MASLVAWCWRDLRTEQIVRPACEGRCVDEPRFQLTRSDAVDWLRSLPNESIDQVVTDPPYESLEKHRAIGTTTRLKHSKASSNDWFSIFPNARFPELFEQVYRVLKKNTHFYLYCDPETMFVAKPLGEAAGSARSHATASWLDSSNKGVLTG